MVIMAGSQTSTPTRKISDNGNGLLLYQSYSSFYSQKVVFALWEKKLKFKSQTINLFDGEQFEPWFIKLNPKSEVPVLKDGLKIIPDSRRIIDYLEDNFSNGNTPRLMPEKGSPQYQTMERMRDLLDNIPMQLVTFGCICHPQLTGDMKLPQVEIEARKNIHSIQQVLLTELCEKQPDYRNHYLVKKSSNDKFTALVKDSNEVEKGLLDVEYALKEVESMLASHMDDKKYWWLCCEKFTIADISLIVLLRRLHFLGLDERFYKDNNFPHIRNYYTRAQRRDSFPKTFNQGSSALVKFTGLDPIEKVFHPLVMAGGLAAVLCAAGLAALLIQRHK